MALLQFALVACGLLALARAVDVTQENACQIAYNWQSNGKRAPGGGKWGTKYFAQGPCIGVSGIGMTQTYMKTVLVIDRTDYQNTVMPMAAMPGQLAWAQEVDLSTSAMKQRPLNVLTNTFCSSGAHVKDGQVFSIGGDQQAGFSDYIAAKGGFSMRAFTPCVDGTCDFKIDGKLTTNRWYPSSQLLGDGRLLVVGGASGGVAINGAGNNVPSIEYYPNKAGAAAVDLPFLAETLPYNLYPFVHLLPNGQVFIFAGESYTLFDTEKSAPVPGVYPKVGAVDGDGNVIVHSYPLAGTSALFTLSPKTAYAPEIMVCGGSATPAFAGLGDENANAPASNGCWRINPLAAKPAWIAQEMKLPRVMPLAVLLPSGHVMIHGGAGTGHSGIPNAAHMASLSPDIYDMATHEFFDGDTGVSVVPRVYHSCAVLLHDGRVFISGSAPHQDGVQVIGDDYPTEFRTEFYYPPYFQLGVPPPRMVGAPVNVLVGTTFWLSFRARPGAKKVSVVLSQPGFSTHGNNQGMRQVELQIKLLRTNAAGMYAALVAAPPNHNIAPATYYWLFVVVDGMPNRDGRHVFIK